MRVLCPTCHGKRTINDPTLHEPMAYLDKDGNSWPQVPCQTCGGSGWVDKQHLVREE